jgi:hypothetical protein
MPLCPQTTPRQDSRIPPRHASEAMSVDWQENGSTPRTGPLSSDQVPITLIDFEARLHTGARAEVGRFLGEWEIFFWYISLRSFTKSCISFI